MYLARISCNSVSLVIIFLADADTHINSQREYCLPDRRWVSDIRAASGWLQGCTQGQHKQDESLWASQGRPLGLSSLLYTSLHVIKHAAARFGLRKRCAPGLRIGRESQRAPRVRPVSLIYWSIGCFSYRAQLQQSKHVGINQTTICWWTVIRTMFLEGHGACMDFWSNAGRLLA